MFDGLLALTADSSRAQGLEAWAQLENAACARRLTMMVTMLDAAYAADGSAARDQWCIDNWAAVTAHIGATQRSTPYAASAQLLVAVSLRDRFPKVAGLFASGLLTYAMVRLIVTRAALAISCEVLAALDEKLVEELTGSEPLSLYRLEKAVDKLLWDLDPLAVRRSQTRARDRHVDVVVDDETGTAQVFATMFATDAHAFNARLDAFAATVCQHDPRTKEQRRADAVGPLSHGADRMACLCGREDCLAALNPPSTGVIIHLVAHQDTVTRPATTSPRDVPPEPDGSPVTKDSESKPDSDVYDSPHAGPVVDDETDCASSDFTTEVDTKLEDTAPTPNEPANAYQANTPAPTLPTPAEECAALDGVPPPMFTKPLRELTLTEALTNPDHGHLSALRTATVIGGGVLPGSIARRVATGATLRTIDHPGQAPPEPRYRPSRRLAEFVRCRDLTCRFPGCKKPATRCDVDHVIPYPYGPTQASNLQCLCRWHHLLKTFWAGVTGWRPKLYRDGTADWTAPDGRTHTTTPGSRMLFPSLCEPTAPTQATTPPSNHARGLRMPRRKATRKQDRARRIFEEREENRIAIEDPPPF